MKINKKTMSLVLGTTLFLSTAASAAAFEDVEGHWAKESVEKLVEENVINGYDDGTFKPDNPIKREEAAKMVSAYFDKLIKSKGAIKTFSDVNSEMWSEVYINSMVDAEIINGYPDGSFKPGNSIKRAEASKMIYEALKNTEKYQDNGKTVSLSDIEGHWAGSAIEKLVAMGAIKGYDDGEFKPENDITRAELAKILNSLDIPHEVRRNKLEVTVKNLVEGYGIQLDDTEVTKDTIKAELLDEVTAEDQDGNNIDNIYINEEDLNKVDKGVEGEYPLRVIFKDSKGRTDERIVIAIVAKYEYDTAVPPWAARIKSCNSSLSRLAIPRYIDGYEVRMMHESVFENSKTLKKIYLPKVCYFSPKVFKNSTLEEIVFHPNFTSSNIAEEAFAGCKSLKEITIPDSITKIEYQAFEKSGLEKVNISKNSQLETMSGYAFSMCESLKEIFIPRLVTYIGEQSFWYSGLEKIDFDENSKVAGIGVAAFYDAKLQRITIPKSVKVINEYAFENNPLKVLVFEDGSQLNKIGVNSFTSCDIEGYVQIPKSINAIIKELALGEIPVGEDDLDIISANCFDKDKVHLVWK